MSVNQQIRLLVVTSTFPRWKDDTDPSFLFYLCKYLSEYGYNIDVIAPHAKGSRLHETFGNINVYRYRYFINRWQNLTSSGGILSSLKKNPFNYILVPFLLLSQLICVYKRIKTVKYDVMHAHWLIPQGFICAVVNRLHGENAVPLICTSHGSDLVSLQDPLSLKIKSWTVKKLDKLSVVSESLLQYVKGFGIPKKNIFICPMGVDLKYTFKNNKHTKRNPRHLIFAGRLIKEKGVNYLIDAVKILKEEFPDISLEIIGDGPERNQLEFQTDKLELNNNVIFCGAIQNRKLPDHFSRAGIAIVPSVIQEGFGLVIVEALGCGCVVVVSDMISAREIITPDKNGLLVEPRNSQAIAKQITRLLANNHLFEELSANARESVIERFDWEKIAAQYGQLFQDMSGR